jgi:hypothetical protein
MSYLKHAAAIMACSLLAFLSWFAAVIVVLQRSPLAPDDVPPPPVHLSELQWLCESITKVMMYPMLWVPSQFSSIGGYAAVVLMSLFWGALLYLMLAGILRLRSRMHRSDALHP